MNTQATNYFDEMHIDDGKIRDIYQHYQHWQSNLSTSTLERKSAEAELLFRRLGITFAVYGESAGSERLIPFDIVPRIFSGSEWRRLELGFTTVHFLRPFFIESD